MPAWSKLSKLPPFSGDFNIFCDGQTCKVKTGHEAYVLSALWSKYGSHLEPFAPNKVKAAFFFFTIFKYIHLAPSPKAMPDTLGMCYNVWRYRVVPMAIALSNIIDEVHWTRRLSEWNHVPHFPHGVTFMVDTFPVLIAAPSHRTANRLTYQPKYGSNVLKCELRVSFRGEIVAMSFPHLGVACDLNIFKSLSTIFPMHDWEWGIGDGIYAAAGNLIVKTPGSNLPLDTQFENYIISHYRQRVEQVIGQVKAHQFFRFKSKFNFDTIIALTTCSVHATSFHLNMQMNGDGSRFEVCGPWLHN